MYKRINVEIDMTFIQEVMAEYKLKSVKEAVNFSLKKTIQDKKERNF